MERKFAFKATLRSGEEGSTFVSIGNNNSSYDVQWRDGVETLVRSRLYTLLVASDNRGLNIANNGAPFEVRSLVEGQVLWEGNSVPLADWIGPSGPRCR